MGPSGERSLSTLSGHGLCRLILTLLIVISPLRGGVSFSANRESFDSTVIPDWELAPILQLGGDGYPSSLPQYLSDSSMCPPSFTFNMPHPKCAIYSDSAIRATLLFVADPAIDSVVRHTIDAQLNRTSTVLPLLEGVPWVVADLDLDGELDIVIQRGDGINGFLDIHSAPTWAMRSRAVFPGQNVYFYATVAQIDADPYIEVFATPMSLGFVSSAAIVQYDPVEDTFVLTDYLSAPLGTLGPSAVGDFDEDGRTEIVSGNQQGHGLFEYDSALEYVGLVGDAYEGTNSAALVVRTRTDGPLQVLTGHSSHANGFIHQVLQGVSDNQFSVVATLARVTGWAGNTEVGSADVDCDGADEMILCFFPLFEAWEWDPTRADFTQICSWDANLYGTFTQFHSVDFNQNGAEEWGTVDHNWRFQVFTTDFCASPSSRIAGWWPLDEPMGSVATDVWGTNDGVLIGSPSPASGRVKGSLSLDGTDDLVRIPDEDSQDFGTDDFSFESWISTASTVPTNPLAAQYDNSSDVGWALSITNGNSLVLTMGSGLPQAVQSPDTVTIADGAWHHVAVTVDRSEPDGIVFCLDGVVLGTGDPSQTIGSLTNVADLLLGSASITSGDTSFFQGSLDEVSIYRSALTLQAIRCIYLADARGKCQPDTSCNCPHQGDIDSTGYADAVDLAIEIDVVFFGITDVQDPYCPATRSDFNVDGFVDAVDVAELVDHVFFGQPGPVDPCESPTALP